MATFDIFKRINKHFIDNWADTEIQYQGTILETNNLDKWISLMYNPIENNTIGLDGTANGRIEYRAILKVFCYAKNPTLAYKLADEIKTFLNGIELENIVFRVGQDGTAESLENEFYEVLCYFNLVEC